MSVCDVVVTTGIGDEDDRGQHGVDERLNMPPTVSSLEADDVAIEEAHEAVEDGADFGHVMRDPHGRLRL